MPALGQRLFGWQHAAPSVPHGWHFAVELQNVPDAVQTSYRPDAAFRQHAELAVPHSTQVFSTGSHMAPLLQPTPSQQGWPAPPQL